MGAFALIEQKKYDEFCELYAERSHLRNEQPVYADLMPGNYVIALLGAGRYELLVSECRKTSEEIRQNSPEIDRSSSRFFIALSIGYFALGQYPEALQALLDGSRAAYQDRPRTQVPGILYYEAAALKDRKALRESKKLLNARLRNKDITSSEFAPAGFLAGKCGSAELLTQVDSCPPILRERIKAQALFYMAVKALEADDPDGYRRHLEAVCALYGEAPSVTMEFEYHLAVLALNALDRHNISSKSNNSLPFGRRIR